MIIAKLFNKNVALCEMSGASMCANCRTEIRLQIFAFAIKQTDSDFAPCWHGFVGKCLFLNFSFRTHQVTSSRHVQIGVSKGGTQLKEVACCLPKSSKISFYRQVKHFFFSGKWRWSPSSAIMTTVQYLFPLKQYMTAVHPSFNCIKDLASVSADRLDKLPQVWQHHERCCNISTNYATHYGSSWIKLSARYVQSFAVTVKNGFVLI